MKKFILFLGVMAMLSSCTSYLMSTVSSSNIPKDDSTGRFYLENDSLIISYSFSGENSPVNIEVYNKLSEPLYVNWERSALIVGDKAYSYVNDKVEINGETSGISTKYSRRGDTYTDGTISATAKSPAHESFIPPKSRIDKTMHVLKDIEMAEVQDSAFKKVLLTLLDGSGFINSKEANFSAENSPLKFKSYLTMYRLKNNRPQQFTSQQDFFISSIAKSSVNPKNLYEFENNPSNVIVHSKTTGYGKTIGIIAFVGAAGALDAADAAVNNNNKSN